MSGAYLETKRPGSGLEATDCRLGLGNGGCCASAVAKIIHTLFKIENLWICWRGSASAEGRSRTDDFEKKVGVLTRAFVISRSNALGSLPGTSLAAGIGAASSRDVGGCCRTLFPRRVRVAPRRAFGSWLRMA
jgi:hypothetical protein